MNPAARFLPPHCPLPDPETLDVLRRSIMAETRTQHPPEVGELAVVILADEAGIQLDEIDPQAIWALSPEERLPLFEALSAGLAAFLR